jgi:hypothetical protein
MGNHHKRIMNDSWSHKMRSTQKEEGDVSIPFFGGRLSAF